MAKKRTRGGFNMSAAIREQLKTNPNLSGKECLEAVKEQHPKEKLNENSFGVAFSNARRKLGIAPKRGGKTVRRKKPQARRATTSVNMDLLQAARKYLSAAGGDADAAMEGIKQIKALQVS